MVLKLHVNNLKGPQENLSLIISAASLHTIQSLHHDSVEHPDLGGRVTIVYVLFLRLSIGSYDLITQKITNALIYLFFFFS